MKKYKSGWEKEKSRRGAEDKLIKVGAKSNKGTNFFHISEPKSNIVERMSSSASALCSSSSDCIAEPEPNIKIVSSGPNLQTKSFNVAEDEAHRAKRNYSTRHGCWMLGSNF